MMLYLSVSNADDVIIILLLQNGKRDALAGLRLVVSSLRYCTVSLYYSTSQARNFYINSIVVCIMLDLVGE